MNRYLLSLFLLAFVLTSCEDKVAQLHDEVMGLHDEAMPDHMKLQDLQDDLEVKLKSLNEAGAADSATVVQYHKAIDQLKGAVKDMDNWMHDWDPDYMEKGKEGAITYLEEQKHLMEKVKYHFEISERAANDLLGESKKENEESK